MDNLNSLFHIKLADTYKGAGASFKQKVSQGRYIPQEIKDLAFRLMEFPEGTSEEAKHFLIAYTAKMCLEECELLVDIEDYLDEFTIAAVLSRAEGWGDYSKKPYNLENLKEEILDIFDDFSDRYTEDVEN